MACFLVQGWTTLPASLVSWRLGILEQHLYFKIQKQNFKTFLPSHALPFRTVTNLSTKSHHTELNLTITGPVDPCSSCVLGHYCPMRACFYHTSFPTRLQGIPASEYFCSGRSGTVSNSSCCIAVVGTASVGGCGSAKPRSRSIFQPRADDRRIG